MTEGQHLHIVMNILNVDYYSQLTSQENSPRSAIPGLVDWLRKTVEREPHSPCLALSL